METLSIILLIVAMILAILTGVMCNSTVIGKIVASFFLILLYWCGVGLIISSLFGILWDIADKKETSIKINIYSINKETTTTGSFTLGSGIIDNDYRYSYYVKYGKKSSFKLDDVSAKNSVFIEGTIVDTYIKTQP